MTRVGDQFKTRWRQEFPSPFQLHKIQMVNYKTIFPLRSRRFHDVKRPLSPQMLTSNLTCSWNRTHRHKLKLYYLKCINKDFILRQFQIMQILLTKNVIFSWNTQLLSSLFKITTVQYKTAMFTSSMASPWRGHPDHYNITNTTKLRAFLFSTFIFFLIFCNRKVSHL